MEKSYSCYDLRQIHFIKSKLPVHEQNRKRWKSIQGNANPNPIEPDPKIAPNPLRR